MDENYIGQVGRRINMLRKNAAISLDELARKVGKSRKTLYNYENGLTAPDIVALERIAQALHVTAYQIMGFSDSSASALSIYPFGSRESLYLYHAQGGEIFCSVIRGLEAASSGGEIIMFYKVDDIQIYELCRCIYLGRVYSEYSTLSFMMRNHFNRAENILINFSIRNPGSPFIHGLISGLDIVTLQPVAFRVLLSAVPMDAGQVRGLLALSAEGLRDLKDSQIFCAEDG